MIGTHHHMSEAHLGRYCAEFDLRYNTRDMTDGERAALILKVVLVVVSPIGGLTNSPPKVARIPRQCGERRKPYFL